MDNFDYRDHWTYTRLMQAVRANPRDNLPRLVLADWLEENGAEERGQFIRRQIDYRAKGWSGRRNPCGTARWRADRITPAERGFADDEYPGLDLSGLIFTRGFLTEVRCRPEQWTEGDDAGRVVADHPVGRVVLTGLQPFPATVSGSCWFRGGERWNGVRWDLPEALFGWLPPSRTPRRRLDDEHNEHEVRAYPSWDSAEKALTHACLAYALEPLPVGV